MNGRAKKKKLFTVLFFSRLFINIHHKHKYKHISSINFSIMFICRISQLSQNTKNSKCLRTMYVPERVWTFGKSPILCEQEFKSILFLEAHQKRWTRKIITNLTFVASAPLGWVHLATQTPGWTGCVWLPSHDINVRRQPNRRYV